MPSIFFTVSEPHFDGGSCVYVLEGLTAYEVLEGGRDSTADSGSDRNVYFGSRDGVYKYEKESLSANKLGPYNDNIIQLQKANGTDKIHYLTREKKLYTLEKNGTVRTKVPAVVCANQFVLDTSNNIYYVDCVNKQIHVIKSNSSIPIILPDEFKDIKLIRPVFIMDECIPVFADDVLYIIYFNGIYEKRDLFLTEKPSAISIDAALYLVVALDGKIYEYSVSIVFLNPNIDFSSTSIRMCC